MVNKFSIGARFLTNKGQKKENYKDKQNMTRMADISSIGAMFFDT